MHVAQVEGVACQAVDFGSTKSNQRERFNAGDQLARDGQAVANMLTRPSDQAARGYIEHRYGVPAPSPSQPREAVPGNTVRNHRKHVKSAIHGSVVPREIRIDPFAEKPVLTEADVFESGVYDLVNKGLIDPIVDLGRAVQVEPRLTPG